MALDKQKRKVIGRVSRDHLGKECPLRILLVDDNKVNVLVAERILSMMGYKTHSVYDGQ